jgi:hypothetical protein
MIDTKVKQLQPNAKEVNKEDSGNKELIKRISIKNSPFEVITTEGKSFGVMGNYRLTEPSKDAKIVKKELEKITWNRIIQVMMILEEVKEKVNNKNK